MVLFSNARSLLAGTVLFTVGIVVGNAVAASSAPTDEPMYFYIAPNISKR
jgi:hypothetical protein